MGQVVPTGVGSLNNALIVELTYDPAGRLVRKDHGNGGYTVYTYDGEDRLVTQHDRGPDGTLIDRLEIDYDARGRRVALRNPDSYDAVGNRTRVVSNGVATDYTTNALNQYTQIGDTSYSYDLCGNLIRQTGPGGVTQYTYDPLNRLIHAASGSDTWQYTFDALGTRIAATESGVTSTYLVDPMGLGNVVGQFDAAENTLGPPPPG